MTRFPQLRKLIDAFIFSNALIALAAGALYWVSCVVANVRLGREILLVVAGTFVLYNYLRLRNLDKIDVTQSPLTTWLQNNRAHMITAMRLAGVIALLSVFLINFGTFNVKVVIIAACLLGLLYSGINEKKNIRRIWFLKTPLVALVWVLLTTVLPLTAALTNSLDYWPLLLAHFLLVLGLTIPFEIRDIKFDKKDELLTTLPMSIGVQNTKYASIISLVCALGLLLVFYQLWALIPVFCLMGFVVLKLDEDKSEYWYTGILDFFIVVYAAVILWLG